MWVTKKEKEELKKEHQNVCVDIYIYIRREREINRKIEKEG